MNFGSALAYIPTQTETEPIYQDEIEVLIHNAVLTHIQDGIAACASAQAEIWAQEAANNADTGLDKGMKVHSLMTDIKEFLREIFRMAEKSEQAHRDTSHHDAQTSHNGVHTKCFN